MYLSVCIGFCTWPTVPSAFLKTRTSRKESFLFSSIFCSDVDIWILIVEENKKFTLLKIN